MGKAKKLGAKTRARLFSQRILLRLGLPPPHSSGAQPRAGDVRDAKRVEYLLKEFKDNAKIPKFLTVPISEWNEENGYADDAANDPFKALATLRAIQKRVPGVSERSLHIIWLLRQPGVCDEFRDLSELDANGDLRYGAFRVADSLEASASVFLPKGFLNFEDFSAGGFYVTAYAAECGEDDGVTEVALRAFEEKSKAEQSKRIQATDEIFIKAVRKGVKEGRKRVAVIPYDGIVGGEGRVHKDRYKEKVLSDQLFGRFGRELVRAGGGDIESLSDDDFIAAAKTKLAVHNRVFMSEPLFTAVAMRGGAAYRRDKKGITAIEQDFEGIAAALTGGMIETGGLNVADLGCEADRVPGRRTEVHNDAHFAFCLMRDAAFAEAEGGTAEFESAYAGVKTLLAQDVFSDDLRMMQRLAATSLLLKEEGLDALAKADAKAFRKSAPPMYDTIDAGTFSRALAAECGRKGGSATAKLVRDYFDPEVEQSAEDKLKAEKVIFSGIPPGRMTGDAKRAWTDKSVAGGACPPGEMTGDAKRAFSDKSVAGGGCPPGEMTGAVKRTHADSCTAGGGIPAGGSKPDDERLSQMIGQYIKKKEDGSPIAVSHVIVRTASGNTNKFYASRYASLEDYNAVYVKLRRETSHTKELYDIMCTSGAKAPVFILPLSNVSGCEGDVIGGLRRSNGAWICWSLEAYINLTEARVTWSVEDVPITDAVLRDHAIKKAEKKARDSKKRKRLAPSAPGPGVVKKRRTT